MDASFILGDKVIMKKGHACQSNLWQITRIGVDIKLKCLNCEREIMMDRFLFLSKLKKVINSEEV